jgi:hypothetical protein
MTVEALGRPAARSDDRLTIPPDRSFLPWTSDNVVRLVVLNVAALGLLITSWYLISGTTSLEEQVGWLKIGMLGLALSGVANGLWLMSGRRAVGLARVQVLGALQKAAAARETDRPARNEAAHDLVYVGPRLTRFHTRDCPLADGRDLVVVSRDEAAARGFQACELCEP